MSIKVFDFFSGCGGTSQGFQESGMQIVFAIDNDPYAAKTFAGNFPNAHFEPSNIADFAVDDLQPFIEKCADDPILFTGCAPCQPYSQQNKQDNPNDKRRALLDVFNQFVDKYTPHFVFVENVPGLQKVAPEDNTPFGDFIKMLERNQYKFQYKIVASQAYGVPQKRRRLVLIASRLGIIDFPHETHGRGTSNQKYSTVSEWIRDFPAIDIGQTHPDIPNHQAAQISDLNLERLRATPMGGDRRNWPKHLQLECHSNGYTGHTDVYGRMHWNEVSSCLTTKCTSISNGRFGHPEQDRAISAREAASLQTFPRDFIFAGGLSAVARQIGNAVPVLLAKRFGENFQEHLKNYKRVYLNGAI